MKIFKKGIFIILLALLLCIYMNSIIFATNEILTNSIDTGQNPNGEDETNSIIPDDSIEGEDGKQSILDLSMLKQHMVNISELKGNVLQAVDLNGDGKVFITDLSRMKLEIVGLM